MIVLPLRPAPAMYRTVTGRSEASMGQGNHTGRAGDARAQGAKR